MEQLTDEERGWVPYTNGQTVLFQNTSTSAIDTLQVWTKDDKKYGSSSRCHDAVIGLTCQLWFNAFSGGGGSSVYIKVDHGQNPKVSIPSGGGGEYILNGSPQTMTVNSISYSDIYSVSIDSSTTTSAGAPWKIEYSKSKGFVRFYMKGGNIYTKL